MPTVTENIVAAIGQIKSNIDDAYDHLYNKTATMPEVRNSANLSPTVDTIQLGIPGITVVSFEMTSAPTKTHYYYNKLHCEYLDMTGAAFHIVLSVFGIQVETDLTLDDVEWGPTGQALIGMDHVQFKLKFGEQTLLINQPIVVEYIDVTYGEIASLNMTWEQLHDTYGPSWADIKNSF